MRSVTRACHVVLNALFLDPAVSGGPETYLRGLAPALAHARPDAELTLVTTRRGAASLRAAGWRAIGVEIREFPCDDGQRVRRQTAEQLMLPLFARRHGGQVLHSLASVAPIRAPGIAHVITLHDVTFMHQETFNPVTTWGMRQIIPRAARHADALISITASARDLTCSTLGLKLDAFTVIPHGVSRRTDIVATPEEDVRRRFALGGDRVVLCVGAKRPHKNQAVLVRALPGLPQDVRLVLAGHPEFYEESLRAMAADLGVAARVVFADRVSDEDLEALWSIASASAFPTLGEGFGFPLAESMLRGVPVAASDLPVLREVGGTWPEYFDPADPVDAARALLRLLEDPPDPSQAQLFASRYTWAASAEATWEVYDRALARHADRCDRDRGWRGFRRQTA